MATVLFWNINKKRLINEIVWLCHHHDVDILVLAEGKQFEMAILESLNSGIDNIYLSPFNLSSRLSFLFRYPLESISSVADDGGIAIRRIAPPIGSDFLLVGLHLI